MSLKIILNKQQFHLKFMLIQSVIQKALKAVNLLTKKNHDHIPCSFGYKLVCIDDRFSKSIVVFRGENDAYKFIKAFLTECQYCKKVMNKHVNKNLIMSEEEQQQCQ